VREQHVAHLRCPACVNALTISEVTSRSNDDITEGSLRCSSCHATYPITRHIPRFVPLENYASGFGLEWTKHAKTQYDSHSGVPLSEERFFNETGWQRHLDGEIILEAGSGSGRFTEHALRTGATVVSCDYSYAVDANYESNGYNDNLLLVQADVFHPPFPTAYFDKIYCFGMLQHTPSPVRAFRSLLPLLKPGAEIVVDVYERSFVQSTIKTKYWVRPLLRRIPHQVLYRLVQRYVDLMWPVASMLRKIPELGYRLNWQLLIGDYSKVGLSGPLLKEWAYLDTFDMLAPRYDNPQTHATVRAWFARAGLIDVRVQRGYNGIEGHGRRPAAGLSPQPT
jgi:SAM-dependent methyltransferase